MSAEKKKEESIPEFSTTLPEKIVKIDGKEYKLRSMMGPERSKWLNGMAQRTTTNAKGETVGVRNYDDLFEGLVSKCLYDPNGDLVKIDVLRTWPPVVMQKLFGMCQDLCGLSKEGEEEAKNS